MKNKMKKALSLLMALGLCVGLIPTAAFATEGETSAPESAPVSENSPTEAAPRDGGSNTTPDPLNGTVYVYLNVGEGRVSEESAPSFQPTVKKPDTTTLESEVKQAHDALPKKPTDVEIPQAPEMPDSLNEAPPTGFTQEDKDAALAEGNAALAEEKTKVEGQQKAFEAAKSAAEAAVKAADEALAAAEKEKADWDTKLEEALGNLSAPSDAEKPGDMNSYDTYEDYAAAVNAYNDKVNAYNTAREDLQKQFAYAEKTLKDKVEAATKAKAEADAKVAEADKALETANKAVSDFDESSKSEPTAVDNYNKALEAASNYNSAIADYTDKVSQYEEDVENYKKTEGAKNVDAYNEAVSKYTEAKNAYDEQVDAYRTAVTEYDNAARDWNAEITQKNIDAAIGISGDKTPLENLLNSYSKDSTLNLEDNDITVFGQVNSGEKTLANLTNSEIDAYNRVVKKYNDAVKNYNSESNIKSIKDTLVNQLKSDSRFKDQKTHSDSGSTLNSWYTIGKVTVGNVFTGTPSDIRGNLGDKSQYDYMTDESNNYKGNDVYYWNKDNGSWSGTYANEKLTDVTKNEYQGMFNDIRTALDTASKENGNLSYRWETSTASSNYIDLSKITTKWVLKVSDGAKDYASDTSINDKSQPCWHLDGYLQVSLLSELAELEKMPASYEEVEGIRGPATAADAPNPIKNLPVAIQWNPGKLTPSQWDGKTVAAGVPTLNLEAIIIPGEAATVPPTPRPDDNNPSNPSDPTPSTPDRDRPSRPTNPPQTNIPEEDVPLTETPVEIPEEDVPLAETPVEIPEENVPLAETPAETSETTETVSIPDSSVPLAPTPAAIPDGAVPMADVPKTGDMSAIWYGTAGISAFALLALVLLERRRYGEG